MSNEKYEATPEIYKRIAELEQQLAEAKETIMAKTIAIRIYQGLYKSKRLDDEIDRLANEVTESAEVINRERKEHRDALAEAKEIIYNIVDSLIEQGVEDESSIMDNKPKDKDDD
tara:strand:+ start:335 stop:679 length:345 start_codon:yes stop_codon:yes gene_type:complete